MRRCSMSFMNYLCEEVTLARYDNARQVCKDLLERKEKLLQTTNSHGITPVMDEKDSDDEEDDEDEVNSEDDEFDDFNIRNSPYPFNNKFRFGEPSVSGFVSKVFKEGMLFRVVDEKGNYHFYNDTLRHIMMVRVRYVLTGAEKVNERAIVSDVQDGREGEREVAIAVLPEETNFLIGNINGRLPSISAKAVQTPDDFVPPSLAKSISAINMDINTVRNSLGQWERATDQSAFLKCCIKKKLRFTDLNFRPSSQSLFRPDCDSVRIPSMTWRRPEQYLYLTELSEARLFRGEISCHLVRQGELLNHTLISGIAAVAMRPDHVRWMFRHPVSAQVGKLERSVGCYSVKLVHNGWWSSFIVDNYFPACMKGPLFARCPADPRRLWVSVLEKAYAKSLGSYSSTCLADLMEVLSDFTGYPYRYFTQDWFLASNCPTTSHSSKLFHFIQKCVASDYLIAVFTPTEEEEEGGTQSVLRKRSSRLIPVNGLLPQFLPGRVYFITDAAYYSELDLKMVRLKNPWTWEAQRNAQKERVKKWKYTAWYDQPDNSISMMSGSTRVADKLGKKKMTDDDRKGTMWLEWKEALSSFTGGGVCYTAWQWRQYKMQNVFVSGFPNFVLEMRTKKKVEGFVTLTLEGIRDTLDEQGNITGSFQKGDALCGVGLVAVRPGIGKADAFEIAGRACEDTECFAAQMNYLKSRDTSMKFSIINSSKPYYFIPVMDPAYLTQHPTVKEMPFVLSVVSSSPSDTDTDGFQILFKKIPNTCQVYNDVQKFSIQSTTAVEANYQLVGERGVKTFKGSAIDDVVFKEECVKK
ncbi:calpain-like protein [Angomonas deanei]|nr:calpain-like protein [Angomonas deanei]|eukprot:EPY26404.1 calpain-like protein [Angomonas deanei]